MVLVAIEATTHSVTLIVVVIQDHIAFPNLTGMNPLLGPQFDSKYPRFLPLSSAYSVSLRRFAFLAAHKLQLGLNALTEGVYAWVSGPTYETPAEGRMLRNSGADVVGMSTIPEVVAGKEEGLEVLVLSLVTNKVVIPDKFRSIKEEVEAEVSSCVVPPVWVNNYANGFEPEARGKTCDSTGRGPGVARGSAAHWQTEGGSDEDFGREDCRADRGARLTHVALFTMYGALCKLVYSVVGCPALLETLCPTTTTPSTSIVAAPLPSDCRPLWYVFVISGVGHTHLTAGVRLIRHLAATLFVVPGICSHLFPDPPRSHISCGSPVFGFSSHRASCDGLQYTGATHHIPLPALPLVLSSATCPTT